MGRVAAHGGSVNLKDGGSAAFDVLVHPAGVSEIAGGIAFEGLRPWEVGDDTTVGSEAHALPAAGDGIARFGVGAASALHSGLVIGSGLKIGELKLRLCAVGKGRSPLLIGSLLVFHVVGAFAASPGEKGGGGGQVSSSEFIGSHASGATASNISEGGLRDEVPLGE